MQHKCHYHARYATHAKKQYMQGTCNKYVINTLNMQTCLQVKDKTCFHECLRLSYSNNRTRLRPFGLCTRKWFAVRQSQRAFTPTTVLVPCPTNPVPTLRTHLPNPTGMQTQGRVKQARHQEKQMSAKTAPKSRSVECSGRSAYFLHVLHLLCMYCMILARDA